jgi:NADH-quinone oxidoreductase subunit M
MDILSLFVVVPVLIVLVMVLFTKTLKQARMVTLVGMLVQLAMAVNLMIQYMSARNAGDHSIMLFTKKVAWFQEFNAYYHIGVDGISVLMIFLTTIIVITGTFVSWKIDYLPKEFFISLIVLASGVYGFFISLDLFTMFVFYEIAVIPMYLLIGIWGSGPREYAAMKLTLMLMGASALLLVALFGIYYTSGLNGQAPTFDILELAQRDMPFEWQKIFYPLAFIGFGTIGALFPFHTWSPDGHASAPTAVSMLHAGVLMKLGGYGIFRFAMYLMPEGALFWQDFFLILAVTGVTYGALSAIQQTDLKYINAYSSVSHLGLVLFALLMINKTAWNGAMLQSLSHGFITALFFALIGMIYGRTHVRDITKMNGMMRIVPFLGVAYVVAALANLGLPGFSGFVAEMNIFVGGFLNQDLYKQALTVFAVTSIVVTAVYMLRLTGRMLFGPVTKIYNDIPKAFWYEKTAIIILVSFITLIGSLPFWWLGFIEESVNNFIQPLIK